MFGRSEMESHLAARQLQDCLGLTRPEVEGMLAHMIRNGVITPDAEIMSRKAIRNYTIKA